MKMIKLQDLAQIEISNVDKKSIEGETSVKLCNFVDVYYNWAITAEMTSQLMDATAKENQIAKFTLRKGQVAITKDSETRDDIGVATYIADDIPGVILGYHCVLITPNENLINGKYLNVIFHSPYAQKYFEANASGSGQRYTLTNEIVGEFPIPVIEIEKQKQIGDLFSNIDRKIANNRVICADLESMAKLLYDYWFVQFDFPDENGKPYKSSGGKMVWNEELKREIPEGWKVDTLEKLISYNRGVSYIGNDLVSNGTPIISLASIDRNGRYIPDGIKYYGKDYPKSKVLKSYDLVMANTDMTQERAVMGKIIFVPDIFEGDVLSTHHITTVQTKNELKSYLMMTTQTEWFHNYIKGFSSGTNVLGMDMIGFEDYLLAYPDKKLLDAFDVIIRNLYAKVFAIYKENERLSSLRDFLLPMLMNGQVKVGSKE